MRWFVLTLAVLTTGCTSTRHVHRADAAALAHVEFRTRGRAVTVALADGTRQAGRLLTLRTDSTVWSHDGTDRRVETDSVAWLALDRRGRNAGIGLLAGLAVGAGVAALLRPPDAPDDTADLVANAGVGIVRASAIPAGLVYGAVFGALWEPRRRWVLTDP